MIQLTELNKTYQSYSTQAQALCNINLTIQSGEIFGVIGKSGAGKTTLLRCINLLERPTSGHVYIHDTDLTTLTPTQLRHKRKTISMVFQHCHLLSSKTVYDNVALPLQLSGTPKHLIEQTVNECLDVVSLTNRAHFHPAALSGGQKQRVAIARALTTQPTLLLCDEITSSLDAESTLNTLRLLKQINQRRQLTIVLITHELDVAQRLCDRVGIIDQGQLIEVNKTHNLFHHPQHPTTKKLITSSGHTHLTHPSDIE